MKLCGFSSMALFYLVICFLFLGETARLNHGQLSDCSAQVAVRTGYQQ